MMNDDSPRFQPFKCPNCNGYKTVSYGKRPCLVCNEKGFIVVDQKTGLPITSDDDKQKKPTT